MKILAIATWTLFGLICIRAHEAASYITVEEFLSSGIELTSIRWENGRIRP